MPDILSLGEPMWEMSAIPDEPGKYTLGYGGDTANFCVAAARQGASVGYLTRVGADPFGDALRDIWRREGIDISRVAVDTVASTGGYFIHHGETGHSFSYARAGSAATYLSPADIDASVIASARVVHASGITQAISLGARAATQRLFETARAAGVLVAFDSNYRPRLWSVAQANVALAEVLPLVDYFFPSIEDGRALSQLTTAQDIIDWAHALGARAVSLKLGADGVLLSAKRGAAARHISGFSVATVDATGAGDCFAGATMARLVAGDDLPVAARYACAAAALTTTGYGAIAAIPTRQQVTAFIQSNP